MTTRTITPWMAAPIAAAALAAAVTAGLAPPPARAADADGNFAIHGIGAVPCSTLTAGLLQGQTDLRDSLGAWLTGYLSATNRLREETYDATPIPQSAALVAMAVNVCVSNPNALVETAVNSLVEALSVAAATTETPQQDVTVGERTVRLREGTLKMVQEALAGQDLFSDPADGTFGDSTEAALRAYQAEEGLTETGLPDAPTIVRLLVGPAVEADQAPAGN